MNDQQRIAECIFTRRDGRMFALASQQRPDL
jgi:hypothetical protein